MKIKSRPILDFWLRIPFIEMRTGLMTENMNMDTKEYCYLDISIFKWDFHVRLYDTWSRLHDK